MRSIISTAPVPILPLVRNRHQLAVAFRRVAHTLEPQSILQSGDCIMKLSRLLLAAAVLALPVRAARADDTEDFLKPENWEGRSDIWRIENGSIIGETKEDPKYNTFLCSKKKYSDFELSFKVQLKDEVGNSGVQIRSERFDKDDKQPFRVRGPQVDVGKGYWGSLYAEGFGMMKQSDGNKVKEKVKPTEFNEFHVVAKGQHITIKVNGETMVDDDFPKLPGKDGKPAPTEGIIAFQAHAGYPAMRVEFKDIKFKKLLSRE
jgi:hypothetical protein